MTTVAQRNRRTLMSLGKRARRNKYHNKKAYLGPNLEIIELDKANPPPAGTDIYDSKDEAAYGRYLTLCQRAGEIRGFERQVSLPIYVEGKRVRTMVVDFRVTNLDGSVAWREVKSKATLTPIWRFAVTLLAATQPDIDYDTAGVPMPKSLRKLFRS